MVKHIQIEGEFPLCRGKSRVFSEMKPLSWDQEHVNVLFGLEWGGGRLMINE